MSLSKKHRSRSTWLLAVAAGWGTSALLVLTDGASWSVLPLVLLAGAMAGRPALVLLLAVALPLQGFAGMAAEIRGPGHFHSHERSAAPHWHGQVEHHRHAGDEQSIEVEDERGSAAALAAGDGKRAVPADTLNGAPRFLPPRAHEAAAVSGPGVPPAGHFPSRPDRPPRPLA
jgi:hypothetical protein